MYINHTLIKHWEGKEGGREGGREGDGGWRSSQKKLSERKTIVKGVWF